MGTASNGDVEIEYEDLGPGEGPVLLLIMGLGGQLIDWDDELVARFVDGGHRVIRFDNRDSGRSTWSEGPAPGPADLARVALGRRRPGYTLGDMAADAVAVLDHAGVDSAHVMGASMGGMIAQTLAIDHPRRVRSLVSVMSTTGSRRVGLPSRRFLRSLPGREIPEDRERVVEWLVERSRAISGPHFSVERSRRLTRAGVERAFHPDGTMFQLSAILGCRDRTPALRRLGVPTLVIHGRVDPLIALSGGQATARAVPGAQLVVHNDMGHDLPPPLWPAVVASVLAHTGRVEQQQSQRLSRTSPVPA